LFAPKKQAYKPTPVDDKAFAVIQQRAAIADAVASAIFGRILRGAGWVSLNNEALAKLLENAVGVTIKKAVEKATWCWYACNTSSEPTTSWEMLNKDDAYDQVVTIRIE
jgi:hypothetical protein